MTTSATPDEQPSPLVARTVALDLDTAACLLDLLPADRPVTWLRRGDGAGRLGRGGRDPHLRRRPGSPTPASGGPRRTAARGRPRRGQRARQRAGLLRLLRLRRRARRLRAGRARGRRRAPRRHRVVDHDRPRRPRRARPRDARRSTPRRPRSRSASPTARSNGEQWMTVVADAVARINAGELEKVVLARDLVATGRRPDRRPLAAAPARRGLPDVLDVPRRRPVRRHPRDAGAPRARPGHLAGARRHHPAYRRRRARPRPRRHPGPLVEGPRGARVRRPLGRRRPRAALLVDERARGAVRAAPAQRHAPRHRRRRRRARRRRPSRRCSSPRRCTPRPRSAARPPRSRPP